MLTNALADGAGPCIPPAWPARSIVPIARTPESTDDSGTALPRRTGGRGNFRPFPAIQPGNDLDRRRQFSGGSRSSAGNCRRTGACGSTFRWSIQATTNLTARLSTDELRLLRRAGLHQICQGVDSASPKILQLMNKTFQDFDSIYLVCPAMPGGRYTTFVQHHLRVSG